MQLHSALSARARGDLHDRKAKSSHHLITWVYRHNIKQMWALGCGTQGFLLCLKFSNLKILGIGILYLNIKWQKHLCPYLKGSLAMGEFCEYTPPFGVPSLSRTKESNL